MTLVSSVAAQAFSVAARQRRRMPAIVVAAVTALALAGCGGGKLGASPAVTASARAAGTTAASATTDGLERAVVTAKSLAVHAAPEGASAVVARLQQRTPLGSPTVLLARATRPGWVQVELPIRPNGSLGWVKGAQVRLEPVPGRIDVDLSRRHIVVKLGGRTTATAPVAIGSPQNPTPTGLFFVTDRVRPNVDSGPYGHFALGLSAHSDTLTEFAGSDGQVGIHGTNDPASIGKAVSHGCIRVPTAVADVLAQIPLGTPVFVH